MLCSNNATYCTRSHRGLNARSHASGATQASDHEVPLADLDRVSCLHTAYVDNGFFHHLSPPVSRPLRAISWPRAWNTANNFSDSTVGFLASRSMMKVRETSAFATSPQITAPARRIVYIDFPMISCAEKIISRRTKTNVFVGVRQLCPTAMQVKRKKAGHQPGLLP